MSNKKIIQVKLDNIRVTTFVRQVADPERINFFLEILKSGGTLEPGEMTEDGRIIDGRTRLAASELYKAKSIPMEIRPNISDQEIEIQALLKNGGGSLPPTNTDIEFVFKGLLKKGMSRQAIIARFETQYPKKYLSSRMSLAQTHLAKETLRYAADLVRKKGYNLEQAVKETGVDTAALQRELGGELSSEQTPSKELGQVKSVLTQAKTKFVQKTGYEGTKIINFAKDGALTEKEYADFNSFLLEIETSLKHTISGIKSRLKKAYEE